MIFGDYHSAKLLVLEARKQPHGYIESTSASSRNSASGFKFMNAQGVGNRMSTRKITPFVAAKRCATAMALLFRPPLFGNSPVSGFNLAQFRDSDKKELGNKPTTQRLTGVNTGMGWIGHLNCLTGQPSQYGHRRNQSRPTLLACSGDRPPPPP